MKSKNVLFKICLCLILAIFVFINLFTTKVSAFDSDFVFNESGDTFTGSDGNTYTFNRSVSYSDLFNVSEFPSNLSIYDNYIIFYRKSSNYFCYFLFNNDDVVWNSSGLSVKVRDDLSHTYGNFDPAQKFVCNSSNKVTFYEDCLSFDDHISAKLAFNHYYDYVFVKSTIDILDSNGNVVFQAPPQQVEGTTILTPIVQQVEMKPLEEVTGILPIVIVVLVGMIAIVKAIRWIIRLMKQA